jgi:hypothetical protein
MSLTFLASSPRGERMRKNSFSADLSPSDEEPRKLRDIAEAIYLQKLRPKHRSRNGYPRRKACL